MWRVIALLGLPTAAAYTVPTVAPPRSAAAHDDDLPKWLAHRAAVSPKFLPAVLATCDDEMIGSVSNLDTLARHGMLAAIFKPVVAASIKHALVARGGTPSAPWDSW